MTSVPVVTIKAFASMTADTMHSWQMLSLMVFKGFHEDLGCIPKLVMSRGSLLAEKVGDCTVQMAIQSEISKNL